MLKLAKRFYYEEKGNIVITVTSFMALYLLCGLIIDYGYVYFMKKYASVAVDTSTRCAIKYYDKNQAAVGNIVIDPAAAATIFTNYLKTNLKLNDDLTPKSGSISDGKVTIRDFSVYNSSGVCPVTNTLINSSFIHVVVIIPHDWGLISFMYSKTDIPIHVDYSLEKK